MTDNDDRTRIYSTPCMTPESDYRDGIYWTGPVVLAGYATLDGLRGAAIESGSHYFDRAALRYFGVKRTELVTGAGGCVTVERQTPPEGLAPYVVRAWFMRDGAPCPVGGCRHDSLADARACARRYFDHFADPDAVEILAPWSTPATA